MEPVVQNYKYIFNGSRKSSIQIVNKKINFKAKRFNILSLFKLNIIYT